MEIGTRRDWRASCGGMKLAANVVIELGDEAFRLKEIVRGCRQDGGAVHSYCRRE